MIVVRQHIHFPSPSNNAQSAHPRGCGLRRQYRSSTRRNTATWQGRTTLILLCPKLPENYFGRIMAETYGLQTTAPGILDITVRDLLVLVQLKTHQASFYIPQRTSMKISTIYIHHPGSIRIRQLGEYSSLVCIRPASMRLDK